MKFALYQVSIHRYSKEFSLCWARHTQMMYYVSKKKMHKILCWVVWGSITTNQWLHSPIYKLLFSTCNQCYVALSKWFNWRLNKEHGSRFGTYLECLLNYKVTWSHGMFLPHYTHTQKNCKNVQKYEQHGTSRNLNKEECGWRRTGRSQQNIQMVQDAIDNDQTISARCNGTWLPSTTFNRITICH